MDSEKQLEVVDDEDESSSQVVEPETKDDNEEIFPDGMKVLAVDDNIVCLTMLQAILQRCRYKVKIASDGATALELLRDEKNKFDLVITDVHMPDMDGLRLLEIVSLEMDIPVIMMSEDDNKNMVMKGIKHGARDYLIKPIRKEEIQNIWQHVVRKNLSQSNESSFKKEIEDQNSKYSKRQREQEQECIPNNDSAGEDSSTTKKPRVVWTPKLHNKFIIAVEEIGIDKAVPKKILEHMGEPGLSRENIASHLQKYRNAMKKNNAATASQQSSNNIGSDGIGAHLSSTTTLVSPNDQDAKIRTTSQLDSFLHEVNGYNKNVGIHGYMQNSTQNSCFSVDQLLRERRQYPKLAGDFPSNNPLRAVNTLHHHHADFNAQYQSFHQPRTATLFGGYRKLSPHIYPVNNVAATPGLTNSRNIVFDSKSASTSYPNICNFGGSSSTASCIMPTCASTNQLPAQNFLPSGQTIGVSPDIQSSSGMEYDMEDFMKSLSHHSDLETEIPMDEELHAAIRQFKQY